MEKNSLAVSKPKTSEVNVSSNLKIPAFMKKSWFYIGLLAVIVVLVFSSFIFSDGMLSSSDQLNSIDSKVFYRTALVKFHQFPLWFSSRLGGMPTIDALFGDALYPPSIAINALLPVSKAIGMRMVLHIFLAGLFFFLLLRKGFGFNPYLAFVGGVFYMLSPEFFSHIYPGHDGKMFVIALLPYVIWRVKALQDKQSILNATLLGVGVGFSLLTSHIQLTYFVMWGLCLYWVIDIAVAIVNKTPGRRIKFTGYFWFAVLIGLAIGLVQLYPSYMYIHDAFSVRGVDRGFDHAASWSMHWPEFFSLIVPEFGNTLSYYWGDNPFKLNTEYVGAVTLLLSVFAVISRPTIWRIFWGTFGSIMVLYAMGAHTPVFQIAYYLVPGVKKFRAPSMLMFWFSFTTMLLAMLFLKDLIKGKLKSLSEKSAKSWSKGLLISMGAITLVALLFSIKGFVDGFTGPILSAMSDPRKQQAYDANFSRNFVPFLWVWWIFAVATVGIIYGVLKNKVQPWMAVSLLLLIGLIDMLRVDAQFIKVINPRPYFLTESKLQALETEMQSNPFRCFTLPGTLPQNGEGIHGLESVSGFHDNELRWYREFRGEQDRNYFTNLVTTSPDGQMYLNGENLQYGNIFLNLANAKYVLARQGDQLIVIENKNALGRVSFTPGYTVIDSSQMVNALRSATYDIKKQVALLEEPSQKPAAMKDSMPLQFSSQWEKYTPNDRVVQVNSNSEGFLRISESYYPGWEIRIDGKKVPYYRSDLAWMAINLPSGTHKVEMIAHSLYLGKVIWISLIVSLLVVLYWIGYAVRWKISRVKIK